MEKGKWDYSTLKSKLDKYPVKPLLKDTDDYWRDNVTYEELQTINSYTDATEKQYMKNQSIKAWRETITMKNNQIENDNYINKSMQKLIIDEEKEFADKSTMFFADLWSTIAYDSQHMIERFECKRGDVKLGKYRDRDVDIDDEIDIGDEESTIYSTKNETINYGTAMAEGNWIWLIYATRETHISVIKSKNIWEDRTLLLNAEKRMKSLRYKSGSINHFLLTFTNAMEAAMKMGSLLTEIDAILTLVNALPDDLFESFKRDFRNSRMRDKFPTEYDEFVIMLKEEYDRLRLNNPKLVSNYVTRKLNSREEAFASGEVRAYKKGDIRCKICKGPHDADDCNIAIRISPFILTEDTMR